MPAHAFWTANAVVNPSTRTALEYPQLKLGEDSKLWLEAASREIGRLAQGKQPDMPTGSNTMHFMDPHNLPVDDRRATYLCIVAAIKLHKAETHRIRIRKLFFSEISCTYTIFLHGHIFWAPFCQSFSKPFSWILLRVSFYHTMYIVWGIC